MDEETVNRISHDLEQVRIVSTGAWHIICNWRVEVGRTAALSVLKEAIACIDQLNRKLRQELDALVPPPEPKIAPPLRRFTHEEHPRGIRSRCRGVRKDGKPCSSRVEGRSAFCRHHQEQANQGSLEVLSALVVRLGHLLPETRQNDDSTTSW